MRFATVRQTIFTGLLAVVWKASAQQPAYLDTSLPAERRAAGLVGRLTIEEKVSQLTNRARAIPRLNIPAYNWWSEALQNNDRAADGGHHRAGFAGRGSFQEPDERICTE